MKLREIVNSPATQLTHSLPPVLCLQPLSAQMKLAYRKLAVFSLLAMLGLPGSSFAADAADPVDQELQVLRQLAQQMLQRIEALEKLQKAKAAGKTIAAPTTPATPLAVTPALPALPATETPVLAAPTPVPAPAPVAVVPSLKMTPKGFKFVGNTVFAQAELQKVLAADVGKEVDFDGLTESADKIKDYYRSKGYFLAIAMLPKQEIGDDGVITIEVLEGRIGKIEFAAVPKNATITESQFQKMIAARLKVGDLITETSLEQPLLQLRDLPGVEIGSEINQGDTPGTANLKLTIKVPNNPQRLDGTLEFDNFGNRFAGEYRGTVKAKWTAPLGIGDELNVNASLAEKISNSFGRIGYLAPVGNWGTRAGFNLSHLSYALGKDFAALEVQGSATQAELVAVHPFLRTKQYNLIGQFAYEKKHLLDKQASVPDQEKQIDAFKFQLNGDYRGVGNVNTAALDIIFGKLKFNDAEQLADDQGRNGFHTAGRFTKINLSFNRLQELKFMNKSLEAMFAFSAQLASKNLTSAEKFVLGGPNRVRGYPAGEAGGDQGFAASAELRYALPDFRWGKGSLSLTAFYDYGMVWRNRDVSNAVVDISASNRRSLSSVGFGFKFGAPDEYLLRADVAWGRSGAATSDAGAHSPHLWLQGIRWF